jgi:acyl dehydratase
MALNAAVKELIIKARIMGFESWQSTYPERAIAIFQAADDQSQYLTDAELAELAQLIPSTAAVLPVVQLLRDRAADIVDEARCIQRSGPMPAGGIFGSFYAVLAMGLRRGRCITPVTPGWSICASFTKLSMYPWMPWWWGWKA